MPGERAPDGVTREQLVLEAWSALKGATWAVFAGFADDPAAGGATPAQMGVLHVLLGEDPPTTPRELAARLDVTPATVTGALNGLEEAGFIERVRGSPDRRVVQVRVTAQGRAAAKKRRERMRAHLAKLFGPLSDAELKALAQTLARVAPPVHGPPGGFGGLLRRDAANLRAKR